MEQGQIERDERAGVSTRGDAGVDLCGFWTGGVRGWGGVGEFHLRLSVLWIVGLMLGLQLELLWLVRRV